MASTVDPGIGCTLTSSATEDYVDAKMYHHLFAKFRLEAEQGNAGSQQALGAMFFNADNGIYKANHMNFGNRTYIHEVVVFQRSIVRE